MAQSARAQVDALLAIIADAAHAALDEYEATGGPAPSLSSLESHPMDTAQKSVEFRKIIARLEGACEQLCSTVSPPEHTINIRAQEYDWACLRVAVLHGIADKLLPYGQNGAHIDELAPKLGFPAFKLAVILRLLATKHCFREVSKDVFANNRLSLTLLSDRDSASTVLFGTATRTWIHMDEYLRDPDYAYGMDPAHSAVMYTIRESGFRGTFYEWMETQPERQIFSKVMLGINDVLGAHHALQVYPWDQVRTVCDVGSNSGGFCRSLLETYPNVHTTLFDLPEVISATKAVWKDQFADRVSFVGGNFFEEVPVKDCDVYYLRNTLHNWRDDQAKVILRLLQKAMNPQSRLLIHDPNLRHMYPVSEGETAAAPYPLLPNYGAGQIRVYNMDLAMLLMFNARERTADEVSKLCASVGLELVQAWDLVDMGLLEFKIAAASSS